MSAFAAAELMTVKINAGARFLRMMEVRHSDPLGSKPGGSRFSDPRLGTVPQEELFSIIYLTESIDTAIQETMLRDNTDRFNGWWPVGKDEIANWHVSILTTKTALFLVDLHTITARRLMGVPTNIVGNSNHSESQPFSLAFYQHPSRPAGILYKSRFSSDINIAVYDRVVRDGFESGPLLPLASFDYEPVFKRLGAVIVEDAPRAEAMRLALKRY